MYKVCILGIDKSKVVVYNVCMVKRLNITLPEELLTKVDNWGKKYFTSRSEVIKDALVEYIQIPLSVKEQNEIIDEIAGTEEASLGTIPITATEKNLKTSGGLETVSSDAPTVCVHGKTKTYCTIAKCENYASWR